MDTLFLTPQTSKWKVNGFDNDLGLPTSSTSPYIDVRCIARNLLKHPANVFSQLKVLRIPLLSPVDLYVRFMIDFETKNTIQIKDHSNTSRSPIPQEEQNDKNKGPDHFFSPSDWYK
jgi:hypothetical protein